MKNPDSSIDTKKSQTRRLSRLVITIAAILLTTMMSSSISRGYAEKKVPVITIHAKRYEFMPAEITLKAGQTVKLIFISDDVSHGVSVDGLLSDLNFKKNQPAEVVITPSKAGDFEGECSRYCGIGHDRMKFSIHVVN